MNNRTIGLKVARLRKEQELTSAQLAERCGLSQPQISRLENGKQGFRSATLGRIAAALGVTPGYFFDGEEEQVQAQKQKQSQRRKAMGQEFHDGLRAQFGSLVVTPGYQQMIRRLTAALAREGTDHRCLRRLVDLVVNMSDEERHVLLTELKKRR
jgi:transcriptional regulator with XRE-family HTH domain